MRPTPGSEVPRLRVPPDVAEEFHNALAGVVRAYATLLEMKQAEISYLRAENGALKLAARRGDDANRKESPQGLESDAPGG
jgi:hypothetical protein